MKSLPFKAMFGAFLLATGAALHSAPAAAQSDVLLRLRSGSPLGDRFRVDSSGGFVAKGVLGIGIIPFTGAGERLMWHPFKAAFRAGGIGAGGTDWDDGNVGFYSWAGGNNTMASQYATFAFGDNSEATSQYAVAFGNAVLVSGAYGFGAGLQSRCSAPACVALGNKANAAGEGAVALGTSTTADANYAVALGYRASADGRTGAFVYGDASINDSILAVANNEFAVRAAGGFRFRSNATLTTGCNLPAGSGVFSCASSRTLKENYLDVDGEELLARIRGIPVNSWNYVAEGRQVRHLGPFAEDFHAAFGLGVDNRSIGLLDIDGVNFAAIKALDARTEELRRAQAELQARTAEVGRLRTELDATHQRLADLEAAVRRLQEQRP